MEENKQNEPLTPDDLEAQARFKEEAEEAIRKAALEASEAAASAAAAQKAAEQTVQDDFVIILASASPRRKQLLEEAGVRFYVHTPAIPVDESLEPDELRDPAEACKTLAQRKAGAVVQEVLAVDFSGMAIILGADTMVVRNGQIYGKPKNLDDGKRMLRELSGGVHQVHTAVSVWMVRVEADNPEGVSLGFRTLVDTSYVRFKELSDEQIAEYLAKGESFDKAGAYAIQGEGAALVEEVVGSMSTVIGLPVERLLKEFPDLVR